MAPLAAVARLDLARPVGVLAAPVGHRIAWALFAAQADYMRTVARRRRN